MDVILLAAMTPNRVIGYKNTIPWSLKSDLQFFKKVTMGHCLLMGRKTWLSLSSTLPGRRKIVLSTRPLEDCSDCLHATSFEQALVFCENEEKVFVVGGTGVFAEGLKHASTLLLTVVHQDFIGDTFFPDIPVDEFILRGHVTLLDDIPCTIYEFQRKPTNT
ncbi:MAG: hypothetical protein CSA32_03370 [Desulfobulbus propionicus]|nr:MAG: hypothetical protein CSA32_03370 [Desulfobulbus propionicus]